MAHQTARYSLVKCIANVGKHCFNSSVMHRWLPSECGVA
nr:MAG TPA: hypothetical protein [Caudoviricetes sp.]